MGGKDVIYMKQQHASSLQPADVQKKLKAMADKRFVDSDGQYAIDSEHISQNDKVCLLFIYYILNLISFPKSICLTYCCRALNYL